MGNSFFVVVGIDTTIKPSYTHQM